MNYVDVKFIGLVSSRLKQFKKKTTTLYNFRCPICGDSDRNEYKARGYLYPNKENSGFIYKCHNCGDSRSLGGLIKFLDNQLYRKYLLEGFSSDDGRFVSRSKNNRPKKQEPKEDFSFLEKKLGAMRVDRIPKNHIAHAFIERRKIPDNTLDRLYFVHDDKVLEKVDPKYKGRISGNNPRLILPFFNRNKKLVGIAARAIHDSVSLRYLAFRLDESSNMIFGIEKIKRNSRDPVYVVEGPIDSLFIQNSVAVGGADFGKLENEIRKDKCIVIFDNEPRNTEIVKKMKGMIDTGYKVCVWPDTIKEKDINDMVLAGKSQSEIMNIINNNTYSGLKAMATVNSWKRVDV